ncbi:hypothetical protein APHAL10511_005240 [Amanita phalloides]|nr:hypothetical protein APHAL10511_005240 [Amanita phalloides]
MNDPSSNPEQPPSPAQPISHATDAQEPFTSSAKADVILRSSDSMDFFVLKAFLSFASPIFDDMMSPGQGDENDKRNGLHIVPLPEDSKTVYNLLLLIYPFVERSAADIGTYLKVARAAKRYQMDKVEERLRKQFVKSGVMKEEPFRSFAIAVHFGWKEEARAAAAKTLTATLDSQVRDEELKMISGSDFHKLIRWRSECHRAVATLLRSDEAQSDQHEGNFVLKTKFLAGVLLDRLKVTNCPDSAIMDYSAIVRALKNVDGYETNNKPKSFNCRISPSNIERARTAMLRVCRSMRAKIDETVSEIAFDICD